MSMKKKKNRRKCERNYAVCINNGGYEVSLERHKIYRIASDARAAELHLLKVFDESGQSYLYPQSCFVVVELPLPVLKALAA